MGTQWALLQVFLISGALVLMLGRTARPLRPCHLTVLQKLVKLETCCLLLSVYKVTYPWQNQNTVLFLASRLSPGTGAALWPCVILGLRGCIQTELFSFSELRFHL